jgi:L-aspartate oxidase
VLADLEMVQFHPTALADGSDPAPLLTEALRGEGAVLVDQEGRRVMEGVHPAGDLAPRDVVSRELWRRIRRGGRIFLDATALGRDLARRFPTVHELCRARGLDPTVEPIPVAPAAHYHMGGILVDHHGRTTVRGLWAAGEVACTGLHGANRLASNSLLEALVFGARAGEDTAARLAVVPREREIRAAWKKLVAEAGSSFTGEAWHRVGPGLRRILWEHAGVERDGEGLRQGLAKLERLTAPALRSAAAHVARWLLRSALERRSSRGAHLRTDADPADDGLYRVLVARGRVHRQRPAWLQGAGRVRAGQ